MVSCNNILTSHCIHNPFVTNVYSKLFILPSLLHKANPPHAAEGLVTSLNKSDKRGKSHTLTHHTYYLGEDQTKPTDSPTVAITSHNTAVSLYESSALNQLTLAWNDAVQPAQATRCGVTIFQCYIPVWKIPLATFLLIFLVADYSYTRGYLCH